MVVFGGRLDGLEGRGVLLVVVVVVDDGASSSYSSSSSEKENSSKVKLLKETEVTHLDPRSHSEVMIRYT